MKNILDYFNCKNINFLKHNLNFNREVKKLEKAQKCRILKYGLSGNFITLHSNKNDVFKWGLTKKEALVLVGHGKTVDLANEKQICFDDYVVKYNTIETASNYDLSVQIFKGSKLYGGTIMKRGSSEKDILKFAIDSIEKKATFSI